MENEIIEIITDINNQIIDTFYTGSLNEIPEVFLNPPLFDIDSEILNDEYISLQPKSKTYEEIIKVPIKF